MNNKVKSAATRLLHTAATTAAVIALLVAAACSKPKEFTIKVDCGSDTERLICATYASPDGINRTMTAVEKGKAVIKGSSPGYTAVTLAWGDGTQIAKCIVRNGDKLTVTPPEEGHSLPGVKGSRSTSLLLEFAAENAREIADGDTESLNRAVEQFIGEHPDDPSSTVVLTDYLTMDENGSAIADSLLNVITPEARPYALLLNYGVINSNRMKQHPERIYPFGVITDDDSLAKIKPADSRLTLLAFISREKQSRLSQREHLGILYDSTRNRRLRIIEISPETDSAAWRKTIADDSTRWIKAWMPGGTAATSFKRMDVARLPYFIMFDSAGQQLHRSSSVEDACAAALKAATRR